MICVLNFRLGVVLSVFSLMLSACGKDMDTQKLLSQQVHQQPEMKWKGLLGKWEQVDARDPAVETHFEFDSTHVNVTLVCRRGGTFVKSYKSRMLPISDTKFELLENVVIHTSSGLTDSYDPNSCTFAMGKAIYEFVQISPSQYRMVVPATGDALAAVFEKR